MSPLLYRTSLIRVQHKTILLAQELLSNTMTQHIKGNVLEAIPKDHTHRSLSSLASAYGLKARIYTRCWFHMWEYLPDYRVEHTQSANALLSEDRLNFVQPRK